MQKCKHSKLTFHFMEETKVQQKQVCVLSNITTGIEKKEVTMPFNNMREVYITTQ